MKAINRSVLCILLAGSLQFTAVSRVEAAPPAAKPPAAGGAPAAPAAPAPVDAFTLSKLAQEGGAAFDAGDYKTAAAKLTPYLENCEKQGITEKMDILLFILGISHMNLQEWGQAIDNLKKYESKFPKGEFIKDVSLQIGRCHALSKNYKDAIAQFEKVKNLPDMKDVVLPLLAEAYEKNDQAGEAVKVLQEFLAGGYGSTERIDAALRLAKIFLETDNVDKGVEVLEKIKNSPSAADYVLILNARAMETAGKLMETQPELALRAFQAVRTKNEALSKQKERNEVLRGKIAEWSRMRVGPAAAKYQAWIDEGTARLQVLEKLAEETDKNTDYDPSIIYNIGRCFAHAQLKRYWEAELAFRRLIEKFPNYSQKSYALYGRIVCMINLNLKKEALELSWVYLKEHPDTAEADVISEQAVLMAMEQKDFEGAKRAADKSLELRPTGANKNRLLLYKSACDFELWAFKDARKTLELFMKEFPNDPLKEEVEYRYAMTFFFDNDYKNTLSKLEEFVKNYPNSQYISDARYRLNIVRYGEEQGKKTKAQKEKDKDYRSNFYEVIKDVDDIIEKYPQSLILGELYALKGDCWDQMTGAEITALEEKEKKVAATECGDAYFMAALKASNDDVMDYALETARTKLQATDRWDKVEEMYAAFVKNYPKHPDRLKGIYWVCQAKVKAAKDPDKRNQAREGVKKYLSDEIMVNINRSNKEGVEMLLSQLVENCVPRKTRSGAAPAGDKKDGAVTTPPPPPPGPEPDPYDVGAQELDKWLKMGTGKLNATGEARVAYAKTLLMRAVPARTEPDPAAPNDKQKAKRIDRGPEIEKAMDELGQKYQPEDFSSNLLAIVGDHLRKRGVKDKATACFNRLIRFFPDSDYLDYGYVGLGDLDYEDKNYAGAEKYYRDARDKVPGMRYAGALMGLSKCLIAQKNFKDPEIEKSLMEILGVKEWKGELHAEALFWLGDVAFEQKNYAVAANYFQRIFLSFAKFPDWCIKGYTRAAECFRAMGQTSEAGNHLSQAKEYLTKRKLETGPQMQVLKDAASKLGLPL